MQRWLVLAGRLGLSLGLYAWLIFRLDHTAFAAALASANRWWLLGSLAPPLLGLVVSAQRWQIALGALGVERSFAELLARYWSAAFYNNVLPGSVGGDLVKVGGLIRSGAARGASVASVIFERALGLWVALATGCVAALWPSDVAWRVELAWFFALVVLALPFGIWLAQRGVRMWPRFGALFALNWALSWPTWCRLVLLSLGFQSLAVLHLWIVAQALSLPVSPLSFAIYGPAVTIVTFLPISLNGIGVRELSFTLLLASQAVAPASSALLGTLVYLGSMIASLPGGVLALTLTPQVEPPKTLGKESSCDPADRG